jgi:hypothetical protein
VESEQGENSGKKNKKEQEGKIQNKPLMLAMMPE